MAYRNGTYVAFHAGGTSNPIAAQSDIKYFNLLKAWHSNSHHVFRLIDSHDKVSSVRDTSKKKTLEQSLKNRLKLSKIMLLIITTNTKNDVDWVPFEISYAVDNCDIPIVATYPDCNEPIINPIALGSYWPDALKRRIDNGTASVIHIPFSEAVIKDAINQFGPNAKPLGAGLGYYSEDAYRSFGFI